MDTHESNTLPGAWTETKRNEVAKFLGSVTKDEEYLLIIKSKDGINLIGHCDNALTILMDGARALMAPLIFKRFNTTSGVNEEAKPLDNLGLQ